MAIAAIGDALAFEREFHPWSREAPSFALPATSGGPVSLADRRGRFVVVHFFATWCAPCREELPALQHFAAQAASGELDVLVISVAEPDGRVRRFTDSLPFALPVLLDRDRAVTRAWGIVALPSSVVLGPDLTPLLGIETDFAWDGTSPRQLIERARQNAPPSRPQTGPTPDQGGE